MFSKAINLAGLSQVQPIKFVLLFSSIVLAVKLYHSQDQHKVFILNIPVQLAVMGPNTVLIILSFIFNTTKDRCIEYINV